MFDAARPPVDETTTIAQLTEDPYAVYRRLRAEAPVCRVAAVGRILLTKADDCRAVKDDPELWSSDDPDTPMRRAFQAHTLMRRDGPDHRRLRDAMAPSFSAANIRDHWMPAYREIAERYVGALPKGETVDLFTALAGPVSARCLATLLGLTSATDAEMQHWSQALIDGAGNFGWAPEPFAVVDAAHVAMNACIAREAERLRAAPDATALSVMMHADDPIEWDQVQANLKIAIGGGINEPRDALLTVVHGLLADPDQREAVVGGDVSWMQAFEEAVRWVAPIQASSRRATRDTEIRGLGIHEGEVVMTIQASANHDEEVWGETGGLFDVRRPKQGHQSFGFGPHFCMGTHVARRMCAQIVLPMLFDRFPDMELATPEVRYRGFGFRGPVALPVVLR